MNFVLVSLCLSLGKDMGCFSSLPTIKFQDLFRRIRCVLACCGGEVIIQNSQIDGQGETPRETVLQHKPRRQSRKRQCPFLCCQKEK